MTIRNLDIPSRLFIRMHGTCISREPWFEAFFPVISLFAIDFLFFLLYFVMAKLAMVFPVKNSTNVPWGCLIDLH